MSIMNSLKKRKKAAVFDIVNTLLVVLITAITAYPLYFCVIASLSDPVEVAAGHTLFGIQGFTLDAYALVLQEEQLWTGYRNTIIYTVLATLYRLAFTIPAAYVLSKDQLPFKGILSWYFFITMYISGGMIPEYLLIKDLGLPEDTIIGGIVRGDKVFIAVDNMEINPYDRVVVFAMPASVGRIGYYFN